MSILNKIAARTEQRNESIGENNKRLRNDSNTKWNNVYTRARSLYFCVLLFVFFSAVIVETLVQFWLHIVISRIWLGPFPFVHSNQLVFISYTTLISWIGSSSYHFGVVSCFCDFSNGRVHFIRCVLSIIISICKETERARVRMKKKTIKTFWNINHLFENE